MATFLLLTMWVYHHSFFVMGSEKHVYNVMECAMAVEGHGHPRSLMSLPARVHLPITDQ